MNGCLLKNGGGRCRGWHCRHESVQSYNFFSTHQIIARKNPTILCRDLWFKNKHLFSMDRVKIGVYFVTGVYPGAR